ncbi:hypothetical protein Gotur_029912 [Gossypium turneri]
MVGYWIVNCDGAFNLLSKEVGIGVIIRDSTGALVAEKGRSFLASSTLEVEALAMHEGLLLADNEGFRNTKNMLGMIQRFDSTRFVYEEKPTELQIRLHLNSGGGCAFPTGWIHPIFSGSYSELR